MVLPGKTELRYFGWMNQQHKWGLKLVSRLAGSEHPEDIEKRVEEILGGEGRAVVVYDEDVPSWNAVERAKFRKLRKKYQENDKVSFYSSKPSIEFWFRLHFGYTSRPFQTSVQVVNELRKYLVGYSKTGAYLETEDWLKELDTKLDDACRHAQRLDEDKSLGSSCPFSKLYLLIESLA